MKLSESILGLMLIAGSASFSQTEIQPPANDSLQTKEDKNRNVCKSNSKVIKVHQSKHKVKNNKRTYCQTCGKG